MAKSSDKLIDKKLSKNFKIKKNQDLLKIDFNNENIIFGKSFFKNDNIYMNKLNKTIFYFIKSN